MVLFYTTVFVSFIFEFIYISKISNIYNPDVSSKRRKFHQRLYYYIWFLIYQYLPPDWQRTLMRVNNKKFLFYTTVLFLLTFKSIYLKFLIFLQSGQKLEPRISNDMWPHVFRYEVVSYFPFFCLRTWIIFCFLSYVKIVHLLKIW